MANYNLEELKDFSQSPSEVVLADIEDVIEQLADDCLDYLRKNEELQTEVEEKQEKIEELEKQIEEMENDND